MWKEFREFIARDNVLDLAGAARPRAPEAVPTTKECPFCFTTIPVKATRCPHCTSELTP